jgi:transcriptional regulator with XRE-family HTH domain
MGNLLLEKRLSLGITQQAFAQKLGVAMGRSRNGSVNETDPHD